MIDLNLHCVRQGRQAFRTLGVTGHGSHSYPLGSVDRASFVAGFNIEHVCAQERASDEALAYYQLSVRDNAKDRAWAERLTARTA